MPATRRLAAILAADVTGYSRLIGVDEQGTLGRLRAIRTELIDPSVAAHNGRIVKTTGDGLLAEFASTVDALECASEVQAQWPSETSQLGKYREIHRFWRLTSEFPIESTSRIRDLQLEFPAKWNREIIVP